MNYYTLLGIDKNATQDEITRAYRRAIFINHPDRNPGKENEKLLLSILVNEAYETLKNSERKKEYDKNSITSELQLSEEKKKARYLEYMKNRMEEHIMKFENNYYSGLRFEKEIEFEISRAVMPEVEKHLGIELHSRFIGIYRETAVDYRTMLFFPSNIYKRKYCILINFRENKLFYILLMDRKEYDSLFKDRKTHSAELYFSGENIKYLDKILDTYIKGIVHYH